METYLSGLSGSNGNTLKPDASIVWHDEAKYGANEYVVS